MILLDNGFAFKGHFDSQTRVFFIVAASRGAGCPVTIDRGDILRLLCEYTVAEEETLFDLLGIMWDL